MPNIVFTLGADTLTFSVGRAYPVYDPAEVAVVTDESEGRQMYAYDKGVIVQYHNLVFERLSSTDFDNFDDWLQNIAVGPTNEFTYTDEDGAAHTVRLVDTKNPLREVSDNRYSGTVQLREEL
jgi:hypothetical protein